MKTGTLPTLRTAAFEKLRALIQRVSGIALKPSKRELVAGRLSRRLRELGLHSFTAYLKVVDTPDHNTAELTELVNCITTNKTGFYREAHHFAMLRDTVARQWIERARRGGSRQVRIWSAGCSTGEEPYTIAMALHDVLPAGDGWDVRILGTDIDTEVLRTAADAVYPADRVDDVPPAARAYLQRAGDVFRIRDDIRARVEFRRLNLIAPSWPVRGPFDAIFCRNVVIYFDPPEQRQLFGRFADMLGDDGRLFVGHSENLTGLSDRFTLDSQTVYRLSGARTGSPEPARSALAVAVEHVVVGDVRASAVPVRYTTVLGSCVSACLFDPVARVGGINHFALPEPTPGEPATTRYGVEAMPQLIAQLIRLGADPARLQAKLFGANIVHPEMAQIGEHNARFARDFLARAGIPIAVDRLGRSRSLELYFLPACGTALFRDLADSAG